jgi:hypothetical protein
MIVYICIFFFFILISNQVSPPNENRIISNSTHKRPWMERYEPVSYKIQTRSGNESEFRDMISRCNRAKVRWVLDYILVVYSRKSFTFKMATITNNDQSHISLCILRKYNSMSWTNTAPWIHQWWDQVYRWSQASPINRSYTPWTVFLIR